MAKRKDKPPPPIAVLGKTGIAPATAFDAEELARFPAGTEFDLVPRTQRSLPHHRLYWQALTLAVEATGLWPSREALHRALKVRLGRVEPILDMSGRVVGMIPDSTSFEAMRQDEFRIYFDAAMKALADATGYDPLEFVGAA